MPTFRRIDARSPRGTAEPYGGADPWVTLIDVFGAIAGATPVREPAPHGGQLPSSVRTSNQISILS